MSFQFINGVLFMDHVDFDTAGAQTDDLDLGATCLPIVPTTNNDAVTGAVPQQGITGEMLWILNASQTNKLVLKHDTGSAVGNRFLFPSDSDFTLAPNCMLQFMFMDQVGRVGWWANFPA